MRKIVVISLLALLCVGLDLEAQIWDERPEVTHNAEYLQDFSLGTWDETMFYDQWETTEPNGFSASDISAGYLQFVWVAKRVILSKKTYVSPYTVEVETNHEAGSSRGGLVIRAKPQTHDQVQEPPEGDPGFNSEGIAFYPSNDGATLVVQFTGAFELNNTEVTRINVAKPEGVASMRGLGKLRIEDFDTTIYAFYNDVPYFRIDFDEKIGDLYTAGTVYDEDMQSLGTFSAMEVEAKGKIAVCQRDAALQLFSAKIAYNDLKEQSISFDLIGTQKTDAAAINLVASATSGLPITFELLSGPATLNGTILTLTGTTGIVDIVAKQDGDSEFYPAKEVIRSFYVHDANALTPDPNSQAYVDNWVATDDLGRQVVGYAEAGDKRDDKLVGVFYYLWHGFHGKNVNDITEILKNYPSDPLSQSNSAWGQPGEFHHWGEPEYGYFRSEDPWVLRRDLQMLANAHVDFVYMDMTNAIIYMEAIKKLCEVSMEMRAEGMMTPEIVFTTHFFSGRTINSIYDTFFASGLFEELWFMWDGKPLILGDASDTELRPEVKDFFTIKYSWAWSNAKGSPNHWQWLDTYPQDYGWSSSAAIPEQIPVAVAAHPTSTQGTSYSGGTQAPVNSDYLTEFTGQGLHFSEQWQRALEVDPEVIMVTQWNEWLAQRFIRDNGNGTYAGHPIKNGDTYFVDAFTEEFNRDMAPMKGGHSDNFYYQLISNIRKFKGMNAPDPISEPKTISVDGVFGEWADVTPVFKDPIGDIMHRDFAGYDPTVRYENSTGRNDIIESRTTHDAQHLFFYVKTRDNLSAYSDNNWMLLFLDSDENKDTGWEGYDFVINHAINSESETSVKKWNGSEWENVGTAVYQVSMNEMEISILRSVLELSSETPEYQFHWADNPQHLDDISCFFTDGESAPDRRFNYRFGIVRMQSAYKMQTIPGTLELEDYDNGGSMLAYYDTDEENLGGAYRLDEAVDISEKSGTEYYVSNMHSNEWLEYSVNVEASGVYSANIYYRVDASDQYISLSVDGEELKSNIILPNTGSADEWLVMSVSVSLRYGNHLIGVSVDNGNGALEIDKLVFTATDVVYPGDGTGLNRTLYNGDIGGRNWFTDSLCSSIDSVLNHVWSEEESPGCGARTTFWNAKWEGLIEPLYTEEYTISLTMNDLARLWIGDQLLLDAWTAGNSDVTHTRKVDFTAKGKVPIRVEYANKLAGGYIKLEWESASQPKEVIPQSQFYYEAPTTGNKLRSELFSPRLYPNPADSRMYVETAEGSRISVYNMNAEMVLVAHEQSNFHSLDLSQLTAGVYIVRIQCVDKIYNKKVIVK